MANQMIHWWGFRLRNPESYADVPLKRRELLAVAFIASALLQLLWLLTLKFAGEVVPVGYQDFVTSTLCLAPILIALVFPLSVMVDIGVSGWLLLAREKGRIRYWDMSLIALGVLGLYWGAGVLEGPPRGAGLAMFGAIVLCGTFLLLFLPKVAVDQRKWQVTLPDWLKESTDSESTGDIGPDNGAAPLYTLTIEEKNYQVGLNIPESLLQSLREINIASQGFLYQLTPAAVVLLEGEPVNGLGREEIQRLCRQFASAVKQHHLTPLQVADLVLFFVQQNIPYRFDIDSTNHVPGGPYEEYGRFALETLKDKEGDCECASILTATILAYLGYPTALLFMKIRDEETGETSGHCAVGLKADGAYFPSGGIPQGMDCFTAEDRTVYLYGEATAGDPRAFGGIPFVWKESIVRDSMKVLPLKMT